MTRIPTLRSGLALALLAGTALGAASALAIRRKVRQAEADHPPRGAFIEVDGVRLHYVDAGEGDAVVFLHGNGLSLDDWVLSGVFDGAARAYRAIAFDRPGFGHSAQPSDRLWTPQAQADVLAAALARLGIGRALVVGHSWGTLVAVAMAARHPGLVRGLVLASGYYHPSVRMDVPLLAPPALPMLGTALRWTLSPWLARLAWRPMLKRVFGPRAVPAYFERYPRELVFRPSQLGASAGAAALMIPAAPAIAAAARALDIPVALVAGHDDKYVSTGWQSVLLHRGLRRGTLHIVPDAGHMVHHAAPEVVAAAIHEVDGAAVAPAVPAPARYGFSTTLTQSSCLARNIS